MTAPILLALLVSAQLQAGAPQDARLERESVIVETIRVTPSTASAGALYQLFVTLANRGQRPASRFRFTVKLNGRIVAAYANARYLHTIAPGESAELRLYNFWNVGAPPGGAEVEVTLAGADWVKSAGDPDGVIAWSAIGPVTGLPATKRLAIPVRAGQK